MFIGWVVKKIRDGYYVKYFVMEVGSLGEFYNYGVGWCLFEIKVLIIFLDWGGRGE